MADKKFEVDFIGIGAAKAATSWIFQCLKEHPQICGGSGKGTHFFYRPNNYEKGIDYYSSFFEKCSDEDIMGEFCPAYLESKRAPSRIHKHFPDVKLIVSLRNPIERAYSHYRWAQFEKNRLGHYDSFEKAIQNDSVLIERGLYYKCLRRYFEIFPEKNILVLLFSDLKKDPLSFIQSIYTFLEVEPVDFVPSSIDRKENATGEVKYQYNFPVLNSVLWNVWNKIRSPGSYGKFHKFLEKSKLRRLGVKLLLLNRTKSEKKTAQTPSSVSDIDSDTRHYLQETFKEDIEKLEELINKDLSHWKSYE